MRFLKAFGVRWGGFIIGILLLASCGGGGLWPTGVNSGVPTDLNVVFITLDGVRWQEFFRKDPAFPLFWQELASSGTVYGNPSEGSAAYVSNTVNVSLPAYMSIFDGQTTGCLTNNCPRLTDQTLLDRLSTDLQLTREQVAVFASWRHIREAVTSLDSSAVVNAGIASFDDGSGDTELTDINREMFADLPPWSLGKNPDDNLPSGSSRWDKYTVALAKRYLQRNKPRFLYLSLNDADEWGHRNDYPSYLSALTSYDGWIAELRQSLDAMGDYGRNTVIIVTTDHGRGSWDQWGWHGPVWPASNRIWLYIQTPSNGQFSAVGATAFTVQHLDIRPTIEALFGLEPLSGDKRGHSLMVRSF